MVTACVLVVSPLQTEISQFDYRGAISRTWLFKGGLKLSQDQVKYLSVYRAVEPITL